MGQLKNSGVFLGLFFMLLVLAGCTTQPPVQQRETKDSVAYLVREKVRTEVQWLPSAPLLIYEQIECDSLTNKPKPVQASARTARQAGSSKLSINLDALGGLTVSAHCDSLLMVVKQLEKEKESFHKASDKEVITVTEFETRWYDKFCRWFTMLILLPLLIAIILKIRKLLFL